MLRYIKHWCKSLLYRFGYEIHSLHRSLDRDDIAALTVKEKEFYTKYSSSTPIFTPWEGHPDFQILYESVVSHTIVSPDRCYLLASLARYASHLEGDFAEGGVYKGGTALLIAHVLKGRKKTPISF